MTRFVLLSLPRSGTVLVRTMLSQHPEARCFGEIFDANYLAAELPRDVGAGDRVEAGRTLLADRIAFTERHCFGPPGAAPAAAPADRRGSMSGAAAARLRPCRRSAGG